MSNLTLASILAATVSTLSHAQASDAFNPDVALEELMSAYDWVVDLSEITTLGIEDFISAHKDIDFTFSHHFLNQIIKDGVEFNEAQLVDLMQFYQETGSSFPTGTMSSKTFFEDFFTNTELELDQSTIRALLRVTEINRLEELFRVLDSDTEFTKELLHDHSENNLLFELVVRKIIPSYVYREELVAKQGMPPKPVVRYVDGHFQTWDADGTYECPECVLECPNWEDGDMRWCYGSQMNNLRNDTYLKMHSRYEDIIYSDPEETTKIIDDYRDIPDDLNVEDAAEHGWDGTIKINISVTVETTPVDEPVPVDANSDFSDIWFSITHTHEDLMEVEKLLRVEEGQGFKFDEASETYFTGSEPIVPTTLDGGFDWFIAGILITLCSVGVMVLAYLYCRFCGKKDTEDEMSVIDSSESSTDANEIRRRLVYSTDQPHKPLICLLGKIKPNHDNGKMPGCAPPLTSDDHPEAITGTMSALVLAAVVVGCILLGLHRFRSKF